MKVAILIAALLMVSILAFSSMSSAKLGVNIGSDINANVASDGSSGSSNLNLGARVSPESNRGKGGNDHEDADDERASSFSDVESELDDDSKVKIFSSLDLKRALVDIDSSVNANLREFSFAQVHRGTGWVTTNDSGKLATVLWVEKTFENTNNTSNSTGVNVSSTERAQGFFKIGNDNYRMRLVSSSDSEIVFSLISGSGNVNGTLNLEEDNSFPGFTTWTGTATLGSRVYDVTLATMDNRIKGNFESSINIKESSKTKIKLNTDVDLSSETQEAIKELKDSLDSVDPKVNIKITAVTEDGNVSANSEIEGKLDSNQQQLVEDLKSSLISSLEDAEDGAQIELEINHESKVNVEGKKLGFWKRIFAFGRSN